MADRLPQVPAAEFVTKWQQHGPQYYIDLGYNAQALRNRAAQLRKKGVPLKDYPVVRAATPGRAKLDIDALKALAEQALSNSAESLDAPEGDSDV
jgi:hypothetical protein